jgi:hypothetical protein
MALLLAALAAGGILFTPSNGDVPPRGLSEPVKSCLTQNAPKVEEAISSLTEGVTFLTDNICAVPLADDNEQRSQGEMKAYKDKQEARCAAERDKPKVKSVVDACQMAAIYDAYDFPGSSASYGTAHTPDATAYAAKLLLDLRLVRLSGKH